MKYRVTMDMDLAVKIMSAYSNVAYGYDSGDILHTHEDIKDTDPPHVLRDMLVHPWSWVPMLFDVRFEVIMLDMLKCEYVIDNKSVVALHFYPQEDYLLFKLSY